MATLSSILPWRMPWRATVHGVAESRLNAAPVSPAPALPTDTADIKEIGTYQDTWSSPDTLWSAQAVDKCYNAVRGVLNLENDKLNFDFCLFDANHTMDATCLKDKIAEDYIGKDVIMGWHGSDVVFAEDGIKMPVSFVSKDKELFVLEGVSGLDSIRVYSEDDKEEVSFLPIISKVTFFDVKENSIMKNLV